MDWMRVRVVREGKEWSCRRESSGCGLYVCNYEWGSGHWELALVKNTNHHSATGEPQAQNLASNVT